MSKLPDSISITWHIDDVLQQAADDEVEITEDEAREILQLLESEHDANVGINWEVISIWISTYMRDKKNEANN